MDLDASSNDDGADADTWQFTPRVLTHGAIVPGLSIEHRYTGVATTTHWIKTVEAIDLDTPVPPEAFLVAVPPGAQIRDGREAAQFFAGKAPILVGLHDSSGTPEAVAEFAAKRGLTWPLAIDRPGGDGFGPTFDAFGVRSVPTAPVIDRQGKLAFLGNRPQAIAAAARLLEPR